MHWEVVEVHPIGDRTLKVSFLDGLTGTVRLDTSFCTGVFRPLLDDQILEQATVQHGVVTWPNDLDLAPDTMYKDSAKSDTAL